MDRTEHSKLPKVRESIRRIWITNFSSRAVVNENFNVRRIGRKSSKIEIITQVDGLKFRESFKKRNYFKVDKLKVPYIDFDDLLINKLATGRYKDLADIKQLKKKKKE